MIRLSLVLAFVASCASPEMAARPLAVDQAGPPAVDLQARAVASPGGPIRFTVSGGGYGEPAYLAYSTGSSSPPCIPAAGGLCLDIARPIALAAIRPLGPDGSVDIDLTVPSTAPIGTVFDLQAVLIRGAGGTASIKSQPITLSIVAPAFGCTDPGAANYDPSATLDDGSCRDTLPTIPGYAGPAGPDLSLDGWTLCSGTADGSTDHVEFYTPCAGFSEVRFACSADANATAEHVSVAVPVPASDFLDSTCDDFVGGANSTFGPGRILSIDASDPACSQYDVSFDLYMDMANGQWGCGGATNTDSTGGRMWMYGYDGPGAVITGCTDPGATNYNPLANTDDGSCFVATRTVPGFAGSLGPDLSLQGFSQCGGATTGSTTSSTFLSLCEGYSEIRFGCSVNADAVAEYVSPAASVVGRTLLDGTCDDLSIGSLSPFGPGHILSVDSSNPGCGQFNVAYEFYMDMVSPQWGCAGIANTNTSGGRMWAWVR